MTEGTRQPPRRIRDLGACTLCGDPVMRAGTAVTVQYLAYYPHGADGTSGDGFEPITAHRTHHVCLKAERARQALSAGFPAAALNILEAL